MNFTKILLFAVVVAASLYRLDAKKGNRDVRNKGNSRNTDRNISHGRSAMDYLPPVSGQRIRLAGNGTFTSGNIEVFLRNQWGIVCDDHWDKMDANVACRQLGFKNGAEQYTHNSQFGLSASLSTTFLMDNVDCNDDELSLLACNYEMESDCIPGEGAGVICSPNLGCPDGWVAGVEGCYLLSNITTTQRDFAVNKCAQIGGHLVNIETEAENHFLSAVFARVPGEPIITGAIKEGSTWMWEKVERSSTHSHHRHRRSPGNEKSRPKTARSGGRSSSISSSSSSSSSYSESTVKVSIHYFKWFPGWLPGNINSEPSNKNPEKCMYLSSVFDHPDKSQGQVDLGYLYWMDEVCAREKKRMKNGFRYLCEKPKEDDDSTREISQNSQEECYQDNGETYRGTQAFTEKGTPCISWSDSKKHTPDRFPDKGLEGHNHCRNPDGDARPWCYVNDEGKFGFCPVPQCSDEQVVVTTQAPVVTTTTHAPECPDDKFYCARSVKCISEQWHCDYEADCDYGEDEIGCDYKILQFDVKKNKKIADEHIKETFMGASNETCAKQCLSKEAYVCRSFSFDAAQRKCELSDVNSKTSSLPYRWSFLTNVYELLSQTETCDGRFTCDNGKCIDSHLVCNQQDDCGDLSDEKLDIPKCHVSEEVKVRLADGDEQSGRVEVQYLGEWGVICDDDWDDTDAAVICNMLGYKGTAIATSLSKYGSGNGEFMLDEVQCTGIEDTIADCPHNGWKVHNCRSFEVAGVQCKAQKACSSDQYTCSRGQCLEASQVCDGTCNCVPDCEDENGNGEHDCRSAALELVNGTQAGSGRVEIVRNGLRGTICDDSWDDTDATVLCKMVGYQIGEAVGGGVFGQGTGPIWLDDVECTGLETSLSNCKMSNWGISDCSHSEDAGVICSNSPPQTDKPQVDTGTLTVHLVDGSTSMEGRVEVIYNTERGTICDDGWDDEDATVVCRMLGYRYGTPIVEAFFGPGSGSIRILLDDVDCDGSETSLSQCNHAGWGINNCGHGEDAGVRCFMGEDGEDQVDTGDDDVFSSVTCGLRPMEQKSRKKREEPEIPERELAPPKFERIIGGFTAAKGFYPWQVGVRRLISEGVDSHWCGGTILSEYWILSAAHCFWDLPKGHVTVRIGDHDNKLEDDFEQEFELEHLINHRMYRDDLYDYDLALLKIKPKNGGGIKFGDHVQPACLPDQTTPYVDGQKCHVSGWGKTEYGYQNMLKSARVPIINDETCQRVYKDITSRMVCAGYLAGGIDSCAGDSGGPLVCDVNGRFTVMGATSWGAGCAEANAPGVYARVTEFIPWIKATIKQYS